MAYASWWSVDGLLAGSARRSRPVAPCSPRSSQVLQEDANRFNASVVLGFAQLRGRGATHSGPPSAASHISPLLSSAFSSTHDRPEKEEVVPFRPRRGPDRWQGEPREARRDE